MGSREKPSERRSKLSAEPETKITIDGEDFGEDGFYLQTAQETLQRAEAAMPGTAALTPILTLEPPPIDPELRPVDNGDVRDFAPDPVAEYALSIPAGGVFSVRQVNAAITPELRQYFGHPTLYIRTPSGRITYMQSSDSPEMATEIIAGWNFRDEDAHPVDTILAGAKGLAAWLRTRPERFAAVEPDAERIAAQCAVALRIIEIEPASVAVIAWPETPSHPLDGKRVWNTLHALGLRWGDMDQFQWPDPTGQTDYLFWAEVDDGELGYALPEDIADGQQHFLSVRFTFDIARTPHPAHVLKQMVRAAEAFAKELNCKLTAVIDGNPVSGPPDLENAVTEVVEKLKACGVKPCASPVLMLR